MNYEQFQLVMSGENQKFRLIPHDPNNFICCC